MIVSDISDTPGRRMPIPPFLQGAMTYLRQLGWQAIASLACCVAVAALAMFTNEKLAALTDSQSHEVLVTRDRISSLRLLWLNLLQAESAQRGYLVKLDDRYLAPYRQAVQQARYHLAQLDQPATPDTVGLSRDAQKLSLAVGARLAEMELTLDFATKGQLEQAYGVLATDRGLALSRDIDTMVTRITTHESRRLGEQQQALGRAIRWLRLSMATGTLLIMAMVFLMLQRLLGDIQQKNRQAQWLESRQRMLDEQVQARTRQMEQLAEGYQMDVERERERLARELHDELGAILTATKMDIAWARRQLAQSHPEIVDKLGRTQVNLDQGIQFKRRIVQDLHPPLLRTFGLCEALRALAEECAERNHWVLDLTLPEQAPLSDLASLAIYRILQETLNNAAKYAGATQVSVHLVVDGEHAKLEIQDNGVGMDLAQLPAGTHGLLGMRHRVTAIGGKIDLRSEPGQGLFTQALIPLKSASGAAGLTG